MSAVHALFDVAGRVALVTGSSRGIGRALAGGLAAAGATVVLNGRDPDAVDAARAALAAETGGTVHAAAFDVTDRRRSQRPSTGSRTPSGRSTSSSTTPASRTARRLEVPRDEWHELMETNVDSGFLVGQAVARHMIAARPRQDHQHLLGAERAGPPRHRGHTPPARAR